MQFLAEYGLFLAKAITIVIAILLAVGGIISLAMRQKKPASGELEITHIDLRGIVNQADPDLVHFQFRGILDYGVVVEDLKDFESAHRNQQLTKF